MCGGRRAGLSTSPHCYAPPPSLLFLEVRRSQKGVRNSEAVIRTRKVQSGEGHGMNSNIIIVQGLCQLLEFVLAFTPPPPNLKLLVDRTR